MTAKSKQDRAIRSASLTDVGMRRDHNEDAVLDHSPLFGVADGVGGAASGEDASKIALDTVVAAVSDLSSAGSIQNVELVLAEIIEQANSRVFNSQLQNPQQAGMATTLTVAIVTGPQVTFGHVGDSRAYRISSDGVIQQLTDDHSVVGELVRQGKLDHDEAAVHPQRNVITRALGSDAGVEVDVQTVFARGGDIFLLCSDGLTGHVADKKIAAIVGMHADDLSRAAELLIAAANNGGGSDNISAVLFEPLAGSKLDPGELSGELSIAPMLPPKDASGSLPKVKKAKQQKPPPLPDSIDDAVQPELSPLKARRPRRESSGSPTLKILIALAILVAIAIVGIVVWSNSYYLIQRSDGRIGIEHGIPALGLHKPYRTSDVLASELSDFDRENLLGNQNLRSHDSAVQTLKQLSADVEQATPDAEPARNVEGDAADAAE